MLYLINLLSELLLVQQLGQRVGRLDVFELALDLTGAHTNQLVKLLVCLVKPLLGRNENVVKLVKFLLDAAENLPNLCAALFAQQGF